jgi:hypothetical protein
MTRSGASRARHHAPVVHRARRLPPLYGDQPARVGDVECLGGRLDGSISIDRLNGAEQLGRRMAGQIDVPFDRICRHNTWWRMLRHGPSGYGGGPSSAMGRSGHGAGVAGHRGVG